MIIFYTPKRWFDICIVCKTVFQHQVIQSLQRKELERCVFSQLESSFSPYMKFCVDMSMFLYVFKLNIDNLSCGI